MSDTIYLEFVEAGASKFWSGTVKGKVLTTRWGKIGTQGQSKEEGFADAASAQASLSKQAAAKMKKGYQAAGAAKADKAAPAAKTPSAKASPVKPKAPVPKKATPKVAAPKTAKQQATPAASPIPSTKPQLTAWLKDAARTGTELAAAAGRFPETDRLIAAHWVAVSLMW
jgi:predicted DNA-binding WGR domain protein